MKKRDLCIVQVPFFLLFSSLIEFESSGKSQMKLAKNTLPLISTLLVTLFLASLVGCGETAPPPPKLAEVTGTIKQKGNPVAGATVTFYPDTKKGNKGPSSSGQTNTEGEFTLTCTGNLKGAVLGHHKVTVTCPQLRSGMDPKEIAAASACKLPKELASVETTPWKAEVTTGGEPFEFEVPEK